MRTLFTILSLSAYGHHGRGYGNYYGDERNTIIEYSGHLKLENDKYPEIDTGNVSVQLLIPYETVDSLELKDGNQIRVKGAEYRKRFFLFKGKKVLRVSEIELNGEFYSIAPEYPRQNYRRRCW